jgi:hypothetical protein
MDKATKKGTIDFDSAAYRLGTLPCRATLPIFHTGEKPSGSWVARARLFR